MGIGKTPGSLWDGKRNNQRVCAHDWIEDLIEGDRLLSFGMRYPLYGGVGKEKRTGCVFCCYRGKDEWKRL